MREKRNLCKRVLWPKWKAAERVFRSEIGNGPILAAKGASVAFHGRKAAKLTVLREIEHGAVVFSRR